VVFMHVCIRTKLFSVQIGVVTLTDTSLLAV